MSTRRRFLGWFGLAGAVGAVSAVRATALNALSPDNNLAPIDVYRIRVPDRFPPELGEIVYKTGAGLVTYDELSTSADASEPFGMYIGTAQGESDPFTIPIDSVWLVAVGRGDYCPSEDGV